MAKAKKSRAGKKHVIRWNAGGVKLRATPWKLRAVFAPLEYIIDQLERDGTIDATPSGTAIFKDAVDGNWYDSPAAIDGVVEAFEIHERRHNRTLGVEPLRQLASKLRDDQPIDSDDTKAARAAMHRIIAEASEMTQEYAQQLIKDFQTMESLQALEAA